MRDHFSEGEILSYRYGAWSRYDGIRGFFFATVGMDDMRMWDLPDDESIAMWTTFFEPAD